MEGVVREKIREGRGEDARRDQFQCSFKVKPIKFRGRVSGEAQRSLATPSLLPFLPSLLPSSNLGLALARAPTPRINTRLAPQLGASRGEISNRITLRYNCLLPGYRCRSTILVQCTLVQYLTFFLDPRVVYSLFQCVTFPFI